jgi:hypothetical protein
MGRKLICKVTVETPEEFLESFRLKEEPSHDLVWYYETWLLNEILGNCPTYTVNLKREPAGK